MDVDFGPSIDFIWGPSRDGQRNDRAPGENFATVLGVTEYTWNTARRDGFVPDVPVTEATEDDCRLIYRVYFYDKCGCDRMIAGADLMVFNTACLSGPGHAAKLAQRIVGFTGRDVDGFIGPKSLAAIEAMGAKDFIDVMVVKDEEFLQSLPTFPMFGHGWQAREEAARKRAYELAHISVDTE